MRRRDFIKVIAGSTTAWPLAASAQQPKVPRIGVLGFGSTQFMGPFREQLRDLGYVEGKNVIIDFRSAEGKINLLGELAAELVRLKVDVIVASQTPAVIAAKQATREIPIVMAPAGDPVGTGLVASLARPGGNVTGLSSTVKELGAKTLELIREVIPSTSRVGVLGTAMDPFTKPFVDEIQLAGRAMRIEVKAIMIRGGEELESAFSAMIRERVNAIIAQLSLPIKFIADLALKHRLPVFAPAGYFAKAGGLIGYGPSLAERGRDIAVYVDKILKGAKPSDLPVQQPTKFELVINLKTAQALGLTVPPTLLARADEVIE